MFIFRDSMNVGLRNVEQVCTVMEISGTVMECELPISMPGEVMEIFKNFKSHGK